MAELKTKPTGESVEAFLNTIGDEGRHRDAFTILVMMRKSMRSEPRMWEQSIAGSAIRT